MNLFDTHTHISAEHFDIDRQELILSLEQNNVNKFLLIDCAAQESDFQKVINSTHQSNIIYCSLGVHPHSAQNTSKNYTDKIIELSKNPKCVAIGEIGLDYHYDFSPRETQKKVFIEQLELATFLNLPVIIHDREAHSDMYEILQSFSGKLTGVMHCYSGGIGLVKPTLDAGLHLGFGGAITFKNAKKALDAVLAVPNNRLLIETDCPYMAPVPHRGKRNDPSFVQIVCEKLAEVKNINSIDMADISFKNALNLFNIKIINN